MTETTPTDEITAHKAEIMAESEGFRAIVLSQRMKVGDDAEIFLARMRDYAATELVRFRAGRKVRPFYLTPDEMDTLASHWLAFRKHCKAEAERREAELDARVAALMARVEALGGMFQIGSSKEVGNLEFPDDSPYRQHSCYYCNLSEAECILDEIEGKLDTSHVDDSAF